MKETPSLHIVKLEASNIKKLKAVSITPEGKVVVISGQNDAGKTSVLDSIAYALGGKDLIAEVPIRTGANKGKIVVDLGEFKVTRSFSSLGGTTLVIEDSAGNPQRSPQTVLDRLTSKIGFDPMLFVRMKPAEQLETLRKLMGMDFTKLDADRKKAYEERTVVNRELVSAKNRAAEVEVDPETPDEEVVVSVLMGELQKIQDHNKSVSEEAEAIKAAWDSVSKLEKEVDQMGEEIAELKRQVESKTALIEKAKGELGIRCDRAKAMGEKAKSSERLDEAPIRQKINEAGAINAKVRDKKRFKDLQKEVAAKQKEADDLTATIEALDKKKADEIASATFPIAGLSLDDTGVLLNGVPFTQGSQARQLQAAVAIGIAMNPTVRVILIRDGSLIDTNSMKALAQTAEENDMQIWIEVVESKDPAAIIIEDGHVKEAEGE